MSDRLNKENQAIWNANANYWDSKIGAKGNRWHRDLISPATIELLQPKPGSRILDIGCGNGVFARTMSQLGSIVTAFDFSENNIKNALKYDSTNIAYQVLDATNHDALMGLGICSFEGAVANMSVMDMPEIDVLFSALSQLLVNKSHFVFSVPHPCFRVGDQTASDGQSIKISNYIEPQASMGEAITNQPKLQYDFHRPISELFGVGFKNNFVVDGFVEPVFAKESHDLYAKIPPVMIVRMKLTL